MPRLVASSWCGRVFCSGVGLLPRAVAWMRGRQAALALARVRPTLLVLALLFTPSVAQPADVGPQDIFFSHSQTSDRHAHRLPIRSQRRSDESGVSSCRHAEASRRGRERKHPLQSHERHRHGVSVRPGSWGDRDALPGAGLPHDAVCGCQRGRPLHPQPDRDESADSPPL